MATAAVVVRHPPDPATATDLGDRLPLYIGIHVALLLLLPLLGLVLWVLLRDIENTPATVSRVLVVPAVAYYAAFDAGMHGDENLHLAVTELLAEYGREHGPRFEPIRVIGDVWSPRSHELRDLLTRNGLPFGFYPADSDEGRSLLAAADLDGTRLPVVLLADGRTLVDPSNLEAARHIGADLDLGDAPYDVTIVGAGPAGLAAAVYASSEGLRTLVIEREAIGGQAGTSSMIRTYLGSRAGSAAAISRCGPRIRRSCSARGWRSSSRPRSCTPAPSSRPSHSPTATISPAAR